MAPLGFVLLPAMAFAAAALSVFLALLLRTAPGAGRYAVNRPFRTMAVMASIYSVVGITHTLGLSDASNVRAALIQVPVAGVLLWSLFRYTELELGPGPRWLSLSLRVSAAAGVLLYALPGVGLTGRSNLADLPSLGIVSATAEQTTWGRLGVTLLCLPLFVVVFRYAVAARRGKPGARTNLLATLLLGVAASADALTSAGLTQLPQFIPAGFTAMLLVLAHELARRWREDAAALDRLREELEQQVAERGAALADARLRLLRTERLALVGRLAGAMAHQINNPIAALTGNVEYLLTSLERGKLPEDADASLEDVLDAARRVGGTVRELLLLSRTATAERTGDTYAPAPVIHSAIAEAETAAGRAGWIRAKVDPKQQLPGNGQLLDRLLKELFTAAAPTATPEQPVQIDGAPLAGGLRLRISHRPGWLDGVQLRDELFQRAGQGGDLHPLVVALNLLRLTGTHIELQTNEERTALELELGTPQSP